MYKERKVKVVYKTGRVYGKAKNQKRAGGRGVERKEGRGIENVRGADRRVFMSREWTFDRVVQQFRGEGRNG
jgi:hypothetical protein